jgi:hypothetical protein
MPPVEASVDVVSVLAADIDADGDLDVVAADANLDLIVWANDGSGHLERVQPRHGRGLEPRPATPTIERRSGAALVSVQPDPVPFSPEHSSRAYVATPASWLLPLSSRAPSSTARRDHASRAPPASTLA